MNPNTFDWISLGGGAAGYFGALSYAEFQNRAGRNHRSLILESTAKTLSKVKISGGGRCNVTHACFDERQLSENYPRGRKELRSVFSRFQPKDTIEWFQSRGVELKREADGRMFPISDDSQSIVQCFENERRRLEVGLKLKQSVQDIVFKDDKITLQTDSESFETQSLLVATGSNQKIWQLLKKSGHKIIQPVPSLFSFNITDRRLAGLSGRSFKKVKVSAKLQKQKIELTGPMLITHWGLSGPAILKFSSVYANELYDLDYKFDLFINFLPELNQEQVNELVNKTAQEGAQKKIKNHSIRAFPQLYWENLIQVLGLSLDTKWSELSKKQLRQIAEQIKSSCFKVEGKTTNKEEFVTAGGVDLKEVDFRQMKSRVQPHLYFAGEVLNIDGITGGFNFQAAWSTSYVAANAASNRPASSLPPKGQISISD